MSEKKEISEEILESLTMEDLWENPNLQKVIKEKYPRAYLAITEPFREFGLYNFIKLAEAQTTYMFRGIDRDNLGLWSAEITQGINVYFSKTYDVKLWVENDLEIQ